MTFRFSNSRTLTLGEIERMDGPHQEQFVATMYGYSEAARAFETPRECVAALGEEVDAFSIELCDIVRDGVVVYEYWEQGAGDGQVFVAGTDETTFVHSSQHRFFSTVADPEAVELASALQAARSARR